MRGDDVMVGNRHQRSRTRRRPRVSRFAIVHELAMSWVEHPFDSDGDVAGERFGDPDASEATMSYTKPDGLAGLYADLTAMAAIWGLEDDRNRNG